jgi:transposase
MWLTRRLVPDHKTIADFRKDNGRAIRQVCNAIIAEVLTSKFAGISVTRDFENV